MADLPRSEGKILFTNLTRTRGADETPETEFVYAILDSYSIKPSLNSQVYIHKSEILEGAFAQFTDGVSVKFNPVRESDEKFDKAIEDGKPIRRYFGRAVTLADSKEGPIVIIPQPDKTEDQKESEELKGNVQAPEKPVAATDDKSKKTDKKAVYTLVVSGLSGNRFSIIGQLHNEPARMTYVISANGPGSDSAEFTVLSPEAETFTTHHTGLVSESGAIDLGVQYGFGSLDLTVRCIESNLERHLTLWK